MLVVNVWKDGSNWRLVRTTGAVKYFACFSMYVNVNRELDPVQGSRQCCSCHDSYACWENQAMHSGLTPLITRTASTNHTCLLYADMFAHSVLTHTNTRVPRLKCSMQYRHWHMPYLCISIENTGHVVSQLCKREQPTYGDRACIWVSESKAIFSEDIVSDKPLDHIILVILLHWAQGRPLFPIPKASSLAPNTKGYFRWML